MPTFGVQSQKNLAKARPELQRLFNEVIKEFDCKVLDSERGKAAQEKAFKDGNSKAHFGQSPHNYSPSIAVDVVPYPVDWNDIARFKALMAVVKRKAKELGIPISAGGDWKSFKDYPHYELSPWRDWAKKSTLIGTAKVTPKAKVAAPKIAELPPIPTDTTKEADVPSSAFNEIFSKVETVLKKPSVPVAEKDTGKVAAEVAAKVAPIVENATNSEPWYKSRIILGLIATIAGFIGQKIGVQITSGTVEQTIDLVMQAVQALGALYALYGRTIASKKAPLGGGS